MEARQAIAKTTYDLWVDGKLKEGAEAEIAQKLYTINTTVTSLTVGGTGVNIEPANNTVAVTSDEEIVALYTGAAPDPNTIMFRFWGDNTRYSMYELCAGDIADSGAGLTGRYNWGKYGNKIIRNWGYLSAQDNINGEPQLKRFH